jgi:CubicO group peptidase (beta-lactamase class C family)
MLEFAPTGDGLPMRIGVLALFCNVLDAPFALAQSALGPTVDSVFADWRSPNSPGCVIGVKRAGESAKFASYGAANLELHVLNDTATRFNVGSVAKLVTSLVIGTIVDEGKLRLDQDVRPLLPDLSNYLDPVTVRQLLMHTSGVRDFRQLFAMAGWRPKDLLLPSDVSGIISRQSRTSFPPGTGSRGALRPKVAMECAPVSPLASPVTVAQQATSVRPA